MANRPRLRTVTRTQGNNRALKDGTVTPAGFDLDFVDVPVLVDGFRRMVRDLEFDVCEMALTTYLCAKAHGTAFTALPVFLVRGFHHGAILYNVKSGIEHPKDLEGRTVGVNRGYTVTTGVWARGVLRDEYGVDLDRVTWMRSGDEHVAAYRPPGNVVPLAPGRTLAELLVSGELAAAIGVSVDHPDVAPLIPHAERAGYDALLRRGHYPINHTVVVRDEVRRARPEVAAAVYDAFTRAKDVYVERLRRGGPPEPTPVDAMHAEVLRLTGADPLPYGLAQNRRVLDELVGHAVAQRILDHPIPLETLFPDPG